MTDIEKLKKNAKRLSREKGIQHCEALDIVARSVGFATWSQLHKAAMKSKMYETK